MVSFEELFLKAQGGPIEYKGQTLRMADTLPTEGCRRFRFTFESSSSEWKQGVALDIQGQFTINRQRIDNAVVFWEDTAPHTFEFELSPDVEAIQVKNVWDVGNGVTESWHNGAAMIVEPLSNGRRYRCNDGFQDDDFDDVIFRIERSA